MSRPPVRIPAIPALAAALLCAACVVQQPPSTDETVRQALPESTEIPPAFEEAAETATGTALDGWLRSFGDPELEDLVGSIATGHCQ